MVTGGFAPPGPLLTLSYAGSKGRARWALRAAYGQRYNRERIEFGNGQFGYDSVEGEWYYNQTLYGNADELWRLSQNTGLAGSISFRLSERQTLTFSCLGLNVRTQQYGLEIGRWLYENIQDSAVYAWYWYPTYMLEQSQWGLARLRWQTRTRNINPQVESGFIGQYHAAPNLSAMSYAMYPGDTAWSYDFGLTGDYEAFWYSWHSRTTGLQSYIHPSLEWLPISGRDWLRIKVGLWYSWEQYRARSRILALMPDTTQPSLFTPEVTSLTQIKDIYLPEYRSPGGFWLLDRSTPFNNWYGTTHIGAGYAMMRMTVQRWEGMIGSRYEVYNRSLGHFAFGSLPARTFLRERTMDLLPSFILKYQTGEASHLRAAAYRTLIRPPVTSQIPVKYFGYVYAHFWTGDTLYRSSSAWNIDLRWERVRSQYRLFAIGLFYKALRNLPEIYLEPSSVTTVLVYKTRNRSYGEVGGIELEMREILWGDEVNPRLWGYFNVTLSESGSRFWKAFRDPYNNRLQGQAPYVVNAGVVSRLSEKWEMGSFFNYTGPQIWIIGFDRTIYPHVVEGSRGFWEAQVSRRLGRWEVRLSVWDILNQPYRRLQRAGNLARASRDQIAVRSYQREEWRFYLTVRYRVF